MPTNKYWFLFRVKYPKLKIYWLFTFPQKKHHFLVNLFALSVVLSINSNLKFSNYECK